MHESSKNTVVSLTEAAAERLKSPHRSRKEKLHALNILFHDPNVVLRGEHTRVEVPEGFLDILLRGDTEVLYYAILLQRPDVLKWDSAEHIMPPDGWYVDIQHPQVKRAQALLDAHALGDLPKDGTHIDIFFDLWQKADAKQREQIMRMFVEDAAIPHWYRASGEPEPKGTRYMVMDDPEVMKYLPADWRAHVEARLRAYAQQKQPE